jgi:hypothetical protein
LCWQKRKIFNGNKIMSSIRVISIIPYKVLPAKLGGEKGIALFTEYLAQQVPVTSVATRNNDPSLAKNYRLLNELSNSKIRYANIFLYFRLRKLIKETRATHLIIEHPYYGWLAWLVGKTTDISWVVHSHNIEYMRSKSIGRWWWKALKWYERWVYRKADTDLFISEDDMDHAIQFMNIPAGKSYPITYGIETAAIPGDRAQARSTIASQYGIGNDEKILLFNGALYHHTNYDALSAILKYINPYLLQAGHRYKIIVCGKGLPAFFNELKEYSDRNIIYAGFVDDITLYFKAADIFLNPIISGGGVKTKAIEAISMNCTVVSTEIGAMGLKKQVCGNKLYVVDDNDWKNFADQVIACMGRSTDTPDAFFDYYYWGNIAKKVVGILESNSKKSL